MVDQTTTVYVSQVLYCCTEAYAELPKGYAWDDVKDFFIKWDTLHLDMKDGSHHEIGMDSIIIEESIDWKRPSSCEIYGLDEEGGVEYGEPLAEQ